MILVDSSVWIDFFRGRQDARVDRLVQAIADRQALIGDLILTEVLQGVADDKQFAELALFFSKIRPIRIVDQNIALQAARHYRTLRARGITVRKTIDTLIATRCIADGIALLYSDRDFDAFAEHLGLRSALAA